MLNFLGATGGPEISLGAAAPLPPGTAPVSIALIIIRFVIMIANNCLISCDFLSL